MIEGFHTFTKSGAIRRAKYSEVCNWIKESWVEISIDCIKNGFRQAWFCDYIKTTRVSWIGVEGMS